MSEVITRGSFGVPKATQIFNVGDLVKIADDYATGYWLRSKDPATYGPSPHIDRGKTGYITKRSGDRYALEIDGKDRAWYDGYALTLVAPRPAN